jgi:hypothetical protein
MSKGTLVAIIFGLLLLTIIVYQTVGLRQYECEVCMELDGRTQCVTVKGETEAQAMASAKESACSLISSGRDQNIRCNNQQPTSSKCKHL